jgi:hypothetical protein
MAALFLSFIGCQQSPPPPAGFAGAHLGTRTVELKQEGDGLAAKGDFERAVVKYQAAVNQEPGDVSLRYALGAALSHLERREETVEQFRWVLAHAKPGSAEIEGVRSWLASAGELNDPTVAATTPAVPASGQPSQSEASDATGPKGTLKGTLDWGSIDPHDRMIHAQARLIGEDIVTRDVKAPLINKDINFVFWPWA